MRHITSECKQLSEESAGGQAGRDHVSRGQFYKSLTLVIYKCSYCFQLGKQ